MTPILMYHHIADVAADAEHRGLFVSPRRFAEQMAFLAGRGYSVVSLDDLRDRLLGRKRLPRRSVVITFDDGGADNFENALPVLRSHNFSATVFVVAGKLGKRREKRGWPDPAARYLTGDEIRELARAGIHIGSHSLSHVRLASVGDDRCRDELVRSRQILEEIVAGEVGWLSYPFGSFSARVVAIAREAGYRGAVSTIRDNRPTARRLYFLPRVMVMPDATVRRFAYYLSPWYHWAHWLKNRRRWAKCDRFATP